MALCCDVGVVEVGGGSGAARFFTLLDADADELSEANLPFSSAVGFLAPLLPEDAAAMRTAAVLTVEEDWPALATFS